MPSYFFIIVRVLTHVVLVVNCLDVLVVVQQLVHPLVLELVLQDAVEGVPAVVLGDVLVNLLAFLVVVLLLDVILLVEDARLVVPGIVKDVKPTVHLNVNHIVHPLLLVRPQDFIQK